MYQSWYQLFMLRFIANAFIMLYGTITIWKFSCKKCCHNTVQSKISSVKSVSFPKSWIYNLLNVRTRREFNPDPPPLDISSALVSLRPPCGVRHTHTHTHTRRETFKRLHSLNNFKLMFLRNVLMMWTDSCFCSTLASCSLICVFHISHNPSKKTVKTCVMLEL